MSELKLKQQKLKKLKARNIILNMIASPWQAQDYGGQPITFGVTSTMKLQTTHLSTNM